MKIITKLQLCYMIDLDFSPTLRVDAKAFKMVMQAKEGFVKATSLQSKRDYYIPLHNIACLEGE